MVLSSAAQFQVAPVSVQARGDKDADLTRLLRIALWVNRQFSVAESKTSCGPSAVPSAASLNCTSARFTSSAGDAPKF